MYCVDWEWELRWCGGMGFVGVCGCVGYVFGCGFVVFGYWGR